MRNTVAALLLLSCGASSSLAQPMDSLRKASPALAKLVPPVPTPESFVADVPRVLSAGAHDSIDAAIRSVQSNGLGDIAVAILPSIGDYEPVDVGLAIYRVWRVGRIARIGDVQRNIGVLLLLVPKELSPNKKGQCWITTGTGSEGMITDATGGTICRTRIIPEMIKRDYFAAVLAGVDAIELRMRADPALGGNVAGTPIDSAGATAHGLSAEAPASEDSGPNPWIVVASVFGALGLGGAGLAGGLRWRRNHVRTCPKCGKKMQRLSETQDDAALTSAQSTEEDIHSVDYDVWQCTCGGRTVIGYVKRFSGFSECSVCHARAERKTQKVLREPSYSSSGSAENTYHCEACGATRKERVTLPQLTASSSSGSGGGGSSFGGSSGGSSFGGSGSSSGGGGGSSY